jgi:hypothetical protein
VQSLGPYDVQDGFDFFPYASGDNSYWTGYFTSKPGLKGLVRRTSEFLQVKGVPKKGNFRIFLKFFQVFFKCLPKYPIEVFYARNRLLHCRTLKTLSDLGRDVCIEAKID